MNRRYTNNQNELSDRNREIYNERKNGAMVVELSQKYHLSIPRIHRICVQDEVKDLREENVKLTNEINSCKNILKHKND